MCDLPPIHNLISHSLSIYGNTNGTNQSWGVILTMAPCKHRSQATHDDGETYPTQTRSPAKRNQLKGWDEGELVWWVCISLVQGTALSCLPECSVHYLYIFAARHVMNKLGEEFVIYVCAVLGISWLCLDEWHLAEGICCH